MIGHVGSCRLTKSSEEFQLSVVTNMELEKGKECLGNPFKSGVSPYGFLYVPFSYNSHEGSLER
jgi:hypothetical protein